MCQMKWYGMFLLGWLGLTLSLPAFAVTRSVRDNGTATAYIAVKGLTRLSVADDRISNVTGQSGLYALQDDNRQGAVFIQLAPDVPAKPLTLFIATEQGHNYILRLIPRQQLPDGIILKPLDAVNPVARQWETTSPYTQAITQLIKDMATDATPDGYAVIPAAGKVQHLGDIANIRIKTIYRGAYLQGNIYQVTNNTDQAITLTEQEFYQSGDRAIALASPIIPAHGQTWLYTVVSRHV